MVFVKVEMKYLMYVFNSTRIVSKNFPHYESNFNELCCKNFEYTLKLLTKFTSTCGLMDRASDSESGDCGFDSHHVLNILLWSNLCIVS